MIQQQIIIFILAVLFVSSAIWNIIGICMLGEWITRKIIHKPRHKHAWMYWNTYYKGWMYVDGAVTTNGGVTPQALTKRKCIVCDVTEKLVVAQVIS